MTVENSGEEPIGEAGVETDSAEPTCQRMDDGKGHISENGKLIDAVSTSAEVDYKGYSLCARLRVDHPFRRRFVHSLWLFWSFVGLGWMVGQMGPSFPDLRLIVHQDLETGAWLFTVFSIGYLVGSFFGGILYDKFNKLLLIVVSVLVMAVCSGVLPWCEYFPLMLAVRFLSGIGAGGLDTGGNADLVGLWDEEGRPYMQALHFSFGFGGIISPLVLEPFLAEKICVPIMHHNQTGISDHTALVPHENQSSDVNSTSLAPCLEMYEETRIHYAFLISFFLILSGAVPFLVMYLKTVCTRKEHHMAAKKDNQERPDKLPLKLKVVFCLLLGSLMFMYCAVEDTFSSFLATFCIQHFDWSKSKSSFATSTHWAAFSVGRFSGVFLVMWFKPVQLIGAYIISLITSFAGLLICSSLKLMSLFWVFVACSGFSMSVIFGSIFTWTEESILKVSGKISSMFLIAASLGLMVNPLFLGHLMDHYTPLWFVYLLFIESCLCLILFLSVLVLVRKFVRRKPEESVIEIPPPEEMKPLAETKDGKDVGEQ